ncbi:CoA transferase [Actinomadura craniellae]|uniref:CoA transferase n=1 Tax=Actinomadura craniellae TaxID=2231787 RepID=UPI001F284581|nr:CoA transferase [Actinomadura craniellae]
MLDGLLVVEGSAFVAAPLGGMTLARLGADVIRFDDVRGGADHGRWPLGPDGSSLFWRGMNKGKRSIAVDLRRPEGRELVAALITAPGPDAGLFLTNFPATGALSYERLRARRDDLIMLTLTGNPDGSSAVDYTVNPATGLPLITGDGREPVNHALPAWDVAAGLTLAVGLLAAERHRARTGRGDHVTLSLADVAFATMADLGYLAQARLLGEIRPALGNDLYGAFGRDFTTRDGRRLIVVAITLKQWRSLVEATGIAEFLPTVEKALDVRLDDEGGRFTARDAVAALMAPWFARRTLAEAQAGLDAAGVCWGPYQSFTEAAATDPRLSTANPLFAEVEHPDLGPLTTPGSPLAFTGRERSDHLRAPLLGEHTDEILTGVLGLSPAEIGRLHDAGLVRATEARP